MKRKQFLAVALSMAVAMGAAGAVTFVSNASADFTQAQTPSQVNYSTLTEAELAEMKSLFDASYYASKYEDVVEKLGSDEDVLFDHFVRCGIWEGRKGVASFDPAAYASAYPELREAYGNNIPMYYDDYFTTGKDAGRTITTVEACEAEGIEVVPFFDNDDLLSTDIYMASSLMGTTDYQTVSSAVDTASESGAAAVNTDTETYVIVSEETAEAIAADEELSADYVKLGTISTAGDRECVILVYKNEGGYGTRIVYDFDACIDVSDTIGFIPAVVFTVDEANEIINNEQYDIPTFDVDEGTIIGTEGIVASDDFSSVEYLQPDSLEAPQSKMMTNYTSTGYQDNAPVGVDVDGKADTVYEIGTVTETDENGDAKVTTIISSEDGFKYEVTYTFQDKDSEKSSEETSKDVSSNESSEVVTSDSASDSASTASESSSESSDANNNEVAE